MTGVYDPAGGHWEMDSFKLWAGLWLPVVECLPGHWAVPVCLVMDYDPLSCRSGRERVIVPFMSPRLKQIITA